MYVFASFLVRDNTIVFCHDLFDRLTVSFCHDTFDTIDTFTHPRPPSAPLQSLYLRGLQPDHIRLLTRD